MSIENPHAFPQPELNDDGTLFQQHTGMMLRDHFAGIALPMAWAAAAPLGETLGFDAATITKAAAIGAYQIADAMLVQRKAGVE